MLRSRSFIYLIALLVFLGAATLVNTALGSPLPLPGPLASLTPEAPRTAAAPQGREAAPAPSLPQWQGEPALSVWRTLEAADWQLRFNHPVNWEPRMVEVGGQEALVVANHPALYAATPADIAGQDVFWLRITRRPVDGTVPLARWVADFRDAYGRVHHDTPVIRYLIERPGLEWRATGAEWPDEVRFIALRDAGAVFLIEIAPSNHLYQVTVDAIVDSVRLERP